MQRSAVRTEPQYAAISVGYRYVDGYHIFTSTDVRGLYVASKDPRNAYDSVAEALQEIVSRQSHQQIEIVPTMTFEEWVDQFEKVQSARPPVMRDREFLIRAIAA